MTPLHEALLPAALDAAVPLAIEEVRTWTVEERVAYCRAHAIDIASRSDVLQFGAGKGRKGEGEAAELFAILARCLACLAFQPGGVKFAERRWEVQ